MNERKSFWRILLAVPCLAACLLPMSIGAIAEPESSFPVTILLRRGDPVSGVGLVTRIDGLAVNNNGDWSIEADTDADASTDAVVLRNGVLAFREGTALPAPAGASISSFDSLGLTLGMRTGWNIFLRGLPTNQDSGVFLDSTLVIQESNISTAPQFTPGTPYIGFFDVKMNNANQMAIVASVDDPVIATTVDRGLVIIQVAPDGTLISESVLAKESDILPGQTVQRVSDFGTGPHESAFNDLGQMVYFADLDGATTIDGVVYLDNTLLAQEGSPSVVLGRNYEFLNGRGMDVNNRGEVVFKANLDGDASTDEMIVARGRELVREGGTVPRIGGFRFQNFGTSSGPVLIDDDGNVLWYGDWDNPDTTKDTGLFLNNALIVQKGALIGGNSLTTIRSGSDAFVMSRNGRHIIFEGLINSSSTEEVAFLITVQGPRPVPDGKAVPGSQHLARRLPGGQIEVTWDATSCPATDYNLFYGDLAGVSTYSYTGEACGLGVTGTAVFPEPPGNAFWLLAGTDGLGLEGGHGYDSGGRARHANAGGRCAVEVQVRSRMCP